MKITKSTLKNLKKYGKVLKKGFKPNQEYDERIALISEILLRSCAICGNTNDGFEIYDLSSEGYATVHGDYEKICCVWYAYALPGLYPSLHNEWVKRSEDT